MADYQVLARRYRPQTFGEVFGQEAIVTTLKNAILHNRLAHAYLFCGSRGTGKTTLARVFAKALNCQAIRDNLEPCNACSSCREITTGSSLDVLEIDGASHRGIDDIRQINETVGYSSASGGYKIYIVDEVHMLTKEAFNALLKTLEEPPKRVKFIFATTEPHKVPSTILSRCQRFNLNRIPLEKILQKLSFIAEQQKMTISEEALHTIATRAEGGMRDAESLLDQIFAFHEGSITAESVADVLGIVSKELFFKLDFAVKEGQLAVAFEIAHQVFSQGKDILHFVESLTEHFRTLLLIKISDIQAPFLTLTASDKEKYAVSAKLYTQEQCLTILEFLVEALNQIRFTPSPRTTLEALLLRILRIQQRIPVDFLVRQLGELEQALNKTTLNQNTTPPQTLLDTQTKTTELPQTITPPPSITASLQSETAFSPPITTIPPEIVLQSEMTEPKASTLPQPINSVSMTVDPSPSPQDLGVKALPKTPVKPVIEKIELDKVPLAAPLPITTIATDNAPAKAMVVKAPQSVTTRTAEEQVILNKKQSQYDTILQFAAVELEGSLQKTATKGF